MRQNVNYDTHNWHKTNLITIIKNGSVYDTLVCTTCGLKGKRFGLDPVVQVNKKVPACNVPVINEVPKQVKVLYDGGGIGVTPNKIYDTVACPDEYAHKFKNDVWVMSDKRNEPVRLLSNEYIIVNN